MNLKNQILLIVALPCIALSCNNAVDKTKENETSKKQNIDRNVQTLRG